MSIIKTDASTVIVTVNSEQKDLQSVIDDLYSQIAELKKEKPRTGATSGKTVGF